MEEENVNTELLNGWNEFKAFTEALELDVARHVKGNAAAGLRVRKGLRHLKKVAGELVKASVDSTKTK